jgi:molecular chaperone GrpE
MNDNPGTERQGEGGPATYDEPLAERDERIAALETERDAVTDRLLRLAAEFENWKKRAVRERNEAELRAQDQVLRDLVVVADELERALEAMTGDVDARDVREGVGLVLRNLQRRLAAHGVTPIDAVGEQFDPRRHDAVARAPSRDVEPGTVTSELQKGYLVNDRLLRPASVIVAETPEPATRAPH